jgi:hypothetical protein
MSFPIFNQARDSINKAYVALQSWNTNPADIPLPDVIDTKRPHLTNQQIAARYLKSVEGNPDIDINKLPKMKSLERIEHELPMADETVSSEEARHDEERIDGDGRNAVDEPLKRDAWNCFEPFLGAKGWVEKGSHINYDLVGNADPATACATWLPRMITCSDEYLKETTGKTGLFSKRILDYRNFVDPDGWECYASKSEFVSDFVKCPTPETDPDEINQQIYNYTRNKYLAPKIYLNQTQLDDFLQFLSEKGELEQFSYIHVYDKPLPPPQTTSPSSTGHDPTVTAAVVGTGTAILLGIAGAITWRVRKLNQPAASVTTTVPLQTTPHVAAASSPTTATPSALASTPPTTTNAAIAPSATGAPPTTTAAHVVVVNTQPSSSNGSGNSVSIPIDLPPAGFDDWSAYNQLDQ